MFHLLLTGGAASVVSLSKTAVNPPSQHPHAAAPPAPSGQRKEYTPAVERRITSLGRVRNTRTRKSAIAAHLPIYVATLTFQRLDYHRRRPHEHKARCGAHRGKGYQLQQTPGSSNPQRSQGN